jgi:hypothetical protein
MYAGLLWWCSVIFVFIDGLPGRSQRGVGGEPGLEHVGDEHAGQLRIDAVVGERQWRLAHRHPLERLAAA